MLCVIVYYRCVPSVLSDTIDKLNLKDAAGKILNGTDVKNGEKYVIISI